MKAMKVTPDDFPDYDDAGKAEAMERLAAQAREDMLAGRIREVRTERKLFGPLEEIRITYWPNLEKP